MIHEDKKRESQGILIVDDVEENRFVLRDIISDMGYLPILTENGVQALKMVERCRPQLIILDVAMPQMDGYEFCRIMKENVDTRDIPIVFISAFDNPADIVQGFNLGGEDYITKPFIPEIVKARVGVHLKFAEMKRNMMEINRQLQTSVGEQLKQMEAEKKDVIYALLRVARECVSYDEAYMDRLKANCRTLAEAMQLSAAYGSLISDSYIDRIELMAPLCNLGNVAVPTDILSGKEHLSKEEQTLLESHTTVGAEILHDIRKIRDFNDFIEMAEEIAHYHHENWDGSGYPEGKKGEEIPLSAQIVAVVDTYCTLTQDDGCGRQEALDIMEQDVGKRFNPELFGILRRIAKQLQ
ncbi:MAG: response regulator [Roseburia sp.]|nr:response regulator [Roseburia sp.]